MGEEAEDVLNSTYIKIRVNVILERAKFNRRYQKEGEKADEYIAALYNLVEICKYGELKEEMLRVIG